MVVLLRPRAAPGTCTNGGIQATYKLGFFCRPSDLNPTLETAHLRIWSTLDDVFIAYGYACRHRVV